MEAFRAAQHEQMNAMATLTSAHQAETLEFKHALEKLCDEAVRICVVAPTVNVHIADKNLKFNSKYGGL